MKVSFLIPNRNNLKYFKWAYESIRENQGNHEVWICSADDANTDGTAEYYEQLAREDPYFLYITNPGPDRIGLTLLYDKIVEELVQTDIAITYHCDMYLCPGALDSIEEHMYSPVHTDHAPDGIEMVPNKKTIVSLTRIEPPLHPDSPEKVISDCGMEPEHFNKDKLNSVLAALLSPTPNVINSDKIPNPDYVSEGVFAPWAFWVEDFKEVEGHDPLFAPQSKEDSDIFNRFQKAGVRFIQTWDGFVYHMTCRGSRRNTFDKAKDIYNDSPEWLAQNKISHNNFIRKWGHHVLHDTFMKPIIPNKYDIGLIIDKEALVPLATYIELLEPYFTTLYLSHKEIVEQMTDIIQLKTAYDMSTRIKFIEDKDTIHDVEVYLHPEIKNLQPLTMLPQILDENDMDEGEYDLNGFDLTINKARNYLQIPNRVVPS